MSRRLGRETSAGALSGRPIESGPPKKEQFELLYGILKTLHDGALDAVLKVMGFLLLAMGWVVTSESARVFLAGDRTLQWATVLVLAMAALLFALFALRVVRESRATARAIEALDYMPAQHFQAMTAHPAVAAGFVVADFVITLVMCVFILRL
jgi:hypothetical protein